ncbi:MAG: hypothetical protein ACREAQ_01170, partial [Nitrososphaera sp.]
MTAHPRSPDEPSGGSVASVRIEGPQRRLSPRDASFLYLERSHSPLHIACIAIVDGTSLGPRWPRASRAASRGCRATRSAPSPP